MVSALSRVLALPARFLLCRSLLTGERCFVDTLSTPALGDAVAVPLGSGISFQIEPYCGQPILGIIKPLIPLRPKIEP